MPTQISPPSNDGLFKHFIDVATEGARKYQQDVKRQQFIPLYARFKLKFYYIDGNSSVHYSYDMFHQYIGGEKKRVTDEQVGLSKLIRCVDHTAGKYVTAVIWACLADETATETARYDCQVVKFIRNRTPVINVKFNMLNSFKNGVLNWRALR